MDITWSAILKVMIAGLATYVLLPAALILRDMLLWKIINVFILSDKLRKKIREYAYSADVYNQKYSGKHDFGENEIESGLSFMAESQKAQDHIQDLRLYINRKSRLLGWLLIHYKQEFNNPIQEWKEQAKAEVERQKKLANKTL
jgi:hypothetical protein